MNMLAHKLKFICLLGAMLLVANPAIAESLDQWVPITHDLPNTDVRAITFSQGDLYAGTWGDGVFRYDPDDLTWTDVSQGLSQKHVSHLEADSLGNLYGFVWPATGDGVEISQFVVRPSGSESWQVVDLGVESSELRHMGLAINADNEVYLTLVGYDESGFEPVWRDWVFKTSPPEFETQELGEFPDYEWLQFSGEFAFSDTGTVYAGDGVLSGAGVFATDDDFKTAPGGYYLGGTASNITAMTWHEGTLWVAASNPKPEIYRVDTESSAVETMPRLPTPMTTYAMLGTVEDFVIRGDGEVFVALSDGQFYGERNPPLEPGEGGVFRLHDDRSGWADVSRGLVVPADVYALRLGMDGDTLYAATDGGVFTSTPLVPCELSAFCVE